MSIREKLAQLTLKKYKDDLLFYLFYTNVGDFMQLAAAAELYVVFFYLCIYFCYLLIYLFYARLHFVFS